MAREVQILAWCDLDMAEGRRVPMAATHEVVVDGGKPRSLDLCEDHEAAWWKPFTDALALGAAPQPKAAQRSVQARPAAASEDPRRRKPRPCVLCGETLQGANHHDRHLLGAHGAPSVLAFYGLTCPLCAKDYTTPQGVAIHATTTHELFTLADLHQAALDAGDPHGILAQRREHLVAIGGSIEPVAKVLTKEELVAVSDETLQAAAAAWLGEVQAAQAEGRRARPGEAVAQALGLGRSASDRVMRMARAAGLVASA